MTVADVHRPDISAHFARVLIERAVTAGCQQKGLLDAVRLSPPLLADHRTRISALQLGALMRQVWKELDDELMGFGQGAHRFGVFALMARQMLSCETLGEALGYAVRFNNLTSGAVRWQLAQEGAQVTLGPELVNPGADREHFIEEFLLLVWHRFSNWLIGERIVLLHTQFRFPAPAHAAEHRLMFPGAVSYRRSSTALVFHTDWLAARTVRSRSELRRYLQQLPDEWFIKQEFEHSVSDQVLRALGGESEAVTLAGLAAQWQVSSRTLHRQLQREGSSFRSLREQVRREQATAALVESDCQVREIARQLGMTEPAFSRAFKQWTGLSPLAYRQARSAAR